MVATQVIMDAIALLNRVETVHQELVVAVEDFCSMPLSPGAQKRLIDALAVSNALLKELEP